MTKTAESKMSKEQRAEARKAQRPLEGKTKAKAEAPAKSSKPAKAAKPVKKMPDPKPSRIESNSETVRQIVKLASRPQGATAKELEDASGWKNAGWPWMFFNKKTGKGIASRYNMKFEVIERDPVEGERTRKAYKLSPQ